MNDLKGFLRKFGIDSVSINKLKETTVSKKSDRKKMKDNINQPYILILNK